MHVACVKYYCLEWENKREEVVLLSYLPKRVKQINFISNRRLYNKYKTEYIFIWGFMFLGMIIIAHIIDMGKWESFLFLQEQKMRIELSQVCTWSSWIASFLLTCVLGIEFSGMRLCGASQWTSISRLVMRCLVLNQSQCIFILEYQMQFPLIRDH